MLITCWKIERKKINYLQNKMNHLSSVYWTERSNLSLGFCISVGQGASGKVF